MAVAGKTIEQKMDEFCRVLRNGGTLVVHPDTWNVLKREAPQAALALDWCAIIGGTPVRANPYMDPGTLYAVPKDTTTASQEETKP